MDGTSTVVAADGLYFIERLKEVALGNVLPSQDMGGCPWFATHLTAKKVLNKEQVEIYLAGLSVVFVWLSGNHNHFPSSEIVSPLAALELLVMLQDAHFFPSNLSVIETLCTYLRSICSNNAGVLIAQIEASPPSLSSSLLEGLVNRRLDYFFDPKKLDVNAIFYLLQQYGRHLHVSQLSYCIQLIRKTPYLMQFVGLLIRTLAPFFSDDAFIGGYLTKVDGKTEAETREISLLFLRLFFCLFEYDVSELMSERLLAFIGKLYTKYFSVEFHDKYKDARYVFFGSEACEKALLSKVGVDHVERGDGSSYLWYYLHRGDSSGLSEYINQRYEAVGIDSVSRFFSELDAPDLCFIMTQELLPEIQAYLITCITNKIEASVATNPIAYLQRFNTIHPTFHVTSVQHVVEHNHNGLFQLLHEAMIARGISFPSHLPLSSRFYGRYHPMVVALLCGHDEIVRCFLAREPDTDFSWLHPVILMQEHVLAREKSRLSVLWELVGGVTITRRNFIQHVIPFFIRSLFDGKSITRVAGFPSIEDEIKKDMCFLAVNDIKIMVDFIVCLSEMEGSFSPNYTLPGILKFMLLYTVSMDATKFLTYLVLSESDNASSLVQKLLAFNRETDGTDVITHIFSDVARCHFVARSLLSQARSARPFWILINILAPLKPVPEMEKIWCRLFSAQEHLVINPVRKFLSQLSSAVGEDRQWRFNNLLYLAETSSFLDEKTVDCILEHIEAEKDGVVRLLTENRLGVMRDMVDRRFIPFWQKTEKWHNGGKFQESEHLRLQEAERVKKEKYITTWFEWMTQSFSLLDRTKINYAFAHFAAGMMSIAPAVFQPFLEKHRAKLEAIFPLDAPLSELLPKRPTQAAATTGKKAKVKPVVIVLSEAMCAAISDIVGQQLKKKIPDDEEIPSLVDNVIESLKVDRRCSTDFKRKGWEDTPARCKVQAVLADQLPRARARLQAKAPTPVAPTPVASPKVPKKKKKTGTSKKVNALNAAAAETPVDALASAAAGTPVDAKASTAVETLVDVKASAAAGTSVDVETSADAAAGTSVVAEKYVAGSLPLLSADTGGTLSPIPETPEFFASWEALLAAKPMDDASAIEKQIFANKAIQYIKEYYANIPFYLRNLIDIGFINPRKLACLCHVIKHFGDEELTGIYLNGSDAGLAFLLFLNQCLFDKKPKLDPRADFDVIFTTGDVTRLHEQKNKNMMKLTALRPGTYELREGLEYAQILLKDEPKIDLTYAPSKRCSLVNLASTAFSMNFTELDKGGDVRLLPVFFAPLLQTLYYDAHLGQFCVRLMLDMNDIRCRARFNSLSAMTAFPPVAVKDYLFILKVASKALSMGLLELSLESLEWFIEPQNMSWFRYALSSIAYVGRPGGAYTATFFAQPETKRSSLRDKAQRDILSFLNEQLSMSCAEYFPPSAYMYNAAP